MAKTKTYIYLGHGMEFLKKGDDMYPDIKQVPAGCTLSTIAESGLASDLRSVLNLCLVSQKNPELVSDPLTHANQLNRMFSGRTYGNSFDHKKRLLEGQYHLKVAGKPFVDKHCSFLLDFDMGNNTKAIFRSGLYEISTVTTPLPVLTAGKVHDPASFNINLDVGITKDAIIAIYNESLLPTSDDIFANMPKTQDLEQPIPYDVFARAVNRSILDSVHEIMVEFPGNHYFFVCKTYESNYDMPFNKVEALRKLSKNTSEPLEELSPVELEGTRKGKFAFRHTMRDLFIKHRTAVQNIKDYSYDGYIGLVNTKFGLLSSGNKKQIGYINDVIEALNSGIERRLFKVDDIEPILLSRIRNTQDIEGVIKFEG